MADGRQGERSETTGTAAALTGGGEQLAVARQCAVTRAALPVEALMRFVRAPDGLLTPDLEQRLPGRGVWLTCSREVLEKAIKTKAFGRSLHEDVRVSDDLVARVESLLEKRVSETLALANKAGLIVCGFEKVDTALAKGGVALLLHGRDAAADGRGKLDRKFLAINREKGVESAIIDVLTSSQMSLAIGRPSVVHAALIPGGLTKRFRREAERLQRYRSAPAQGQSLETNDLSHDRKEG